MTQNSELYTFGLATSGQLGLGDDCIDKAFRPEHVNLGDVGAQKVALGDTHSLILTDRGSLMTTGQNDKYQLGIDPDQRDLKIFYFTKITNFKIGDRFEKF